ncbi:hypothetical protein IW492_16220 [Enterococcus sp. BWB1-3]|uniref:hypothetical protein n=1 Tax=unclassified Enterococcus TaxID=2608891 RepID=UPI0019221EAA|nr:MULTISPECIES: hypothetical protein [unclassified Enterococcus]MBL1230775.1 hypothetical protein [Enterococcus sp. BWB1-3]MCB5953220.1 hypothetical protein [Enterococcus sp. BWT-B8]MCB5956232.1 hypothetical protein [Enterococcus sp. CWB-B31]
MTKEFKERIIKLKNQYPELSLEEKKEQKKLLKKRNKIAYHRCEMMRHEILRLEAKRSQLLLEGNEEQVAEIEDKILEKKGQWLKIFYTKLEKV